MTEVGRVSVRVTPDTDRFRSDLRRQLERTDEPVQVDVDLDAAGAMAHMRELMTKLKAQAAGGVDINTNLTRGLGDRAQELTRNLDKIGGSAASAGEGLASVGRTGAIVVAVLAAAAPAVGLVSGLLAGLPSLIGAFGAGAGAVALGLDGIKAAASKLQPQLDTLKASVSGVFEQRLGPIFDQLTSLLPTLQTGMGQVANGLTDMFQGVANALTSGAGLSQLQNILTQTAGLFSSMQPVVQSFTSSFLTLANAGSNAFGQLLGPLQTFATQFGDVVNRITSNGAFQGAMQGLSQTLGSVLSLFNRLFESGVQAMGQLGGPLSTLINGLGDAFVAAMPALTSFSSLIGNVLGSALSALAPSIQAITPAFTALANTLGGMLSANLTSLAPVLTQIASAIGTTLVTALQAIQPIMPGLLQTFRDLTTAVSGQLAQYLPSLAQSFGQLLGAVLPLTPLLARLASEGLTAILPALTALAPATTAAISAFASIVSAVSSAAQAFLSGAESVRSFVASVVEGVGNVIAQVTQLPGKLTAAVSNFGSLLVGAGQALIQGLINGIKSMVSAAVSAASDVASSVVGAVKGFLGIHSPSKVFNDIGVNIGEGLQEGLKAQTAAVVGTAKDMADKVAQAGQMTDDLSKRGANIGIDFAKANANQLMQDLGMSGNGAVPAIAGQLLDWGAQTVFNFNVSNVDEAIAVKNNQLNKQSLQWTGR
jgi:phage-related protein